MTSRGLQVFDLDGSNLLDFDFTNLTSHSLPAMEMPTAHFYGSPSDGKHIAQLPTCSAILATLHAALIVTLQGL